MASRAGPSPNKLLRLSPPNARAAGKQHGLLDLDDDTLARIFTFYSWGESVTMFRFLPLDSQRFCVPWRSNPLPATCSRLLGVFRILHIHAITNSRKILPAESRNANVFRRDDYWPLAQFLGRFPALNDLSLCDLALLPGTGSTDSPLPRIVQIDSLTIGAAADSSHAPSKVDLLMDLQFLFPSLKYLELYLHCLTYDEFGKTLKKWSTTLETLLLGLTETPRDSFDRFGFDREHGLPDEHQCFLRRHSRVPELPPFFDFLALERLEIVQCIVDLSILESLPPNLETLTLVGPRLKDDSKLLSVLGGNKLRKFNLALNDVCAELLSGVVFDLPSSIEDLSLSIPIGHNYAPLEAAPFIRPLSNIQRIEVSGAGGLVNWKSVLPFDADLKEIRIRFCNLKGSLISSVDLPLFNGLTSLCLDCVLLDSARRTVWLAITEMPRLEDIEFHSCGFDAWDCREMFRDLHSSDKRNRGKYALSSIELEFEGCVSAIPCKDEAVEPVYDCPDSECEFSTAGHSEWSEEEKERNLVRCEESDELSEALLGALVEFHGANVKLTAVRCVCHYAIEYLRPLQGSQV